jgi:hypothetical protein
MYAKRIALLVALTALLPARLALAREGGSPAAASGPGGELQLSVSFWRGPELRRDGIRLELGTFGGGYQDIFAGSDRALAAMRTYRGLRIAGTGCRLLAVGALVTNVVLAATGTLDFGSAGSLGLLFSALGLSVGGSAFMQGADVYLSRAVDQYNGDRRDAWLQGRSFSLSLGHRF